MLFSRYSLVLLIFFCMVCSWVYSYGLNGPFLLDDGANLARLGLVQQVGGLNGYLLYVFDGVSSFLGRPISLFTFALQAEHWPNNPAAFKTVNIIIHIANALVLFLSLHLALVLANVELKRAELIALIAAIVWLLHPIHVSTVLYVVQRMTELSVLFVLLGIYGYLLGRRKMFQGGRYGLVWMTMALVVCTTLAVLSKENGVLLPLFILLIEWILLADQPVTKYFIWWKRLVLYLPLLVLSAYLLAGIPGYISGAYQLREFDMQGRLLTQLHALLDYTYKIILPVTADFGLYHDDFPLANSMFEPGPALGMLLLLMMLVAAVWARRRHKLLAFGLLWFLCGHSLESSFLPLELYFEHRNYVPSIGLVLVMIWLALQIYDRVSLPKVRAWLRLCGLMFVFGVASTTLVQAGIWGSEARLTLQWAEQQPNSKRAQASAADMMFRLDDFDAAVPYVEQLVLIAPNDPTPYLMRLNLGCVNHSDQAAYARQYADALRVAQTGIYSLGTINKLRQWRNLVLEQRCPSFVNKEDVSQLIAVLLQNPQYNSLKRNLLQIEAHIYGVTDEPQRAAELCVTALAIGSDVELALRCVRLLSMAGQLVEAQRVLEETVRKHEADMGYEQLWLPKVDEWRRYFASKQGQAG